MKSRSSSLKFFRAHAVDLYAQQPIFVWNGGVTRFIYWCGYIGLQSHGIVRYNYHQP